MGLKMFKNTETTGAYVGSIIAFFSGLSLTDWGAIFGILFGLLTFFINWYYKRKETKLKEIELKHRLNIEDLEL